MNWPDEQIRWYTEVGRLKAAIENLANGDIETKELRAGWQRIVAEGRQRGERLRARSEIVNTPPGFDLVALVIDLENLG